MVIIRRHSALLNLTVKGNDDYKSSLMYSFANVFANADETVKKRAAKFIRHSFLDMDATMIIFVAQQLMQLEGKGH